MEKILGDPLPEIVFSSSDPAISQAIRRAIKAQKLRKIATRIYSSNFDDSPEDIVARHRYYILGKLFPKAVISHRSAFEGGFASDHSIVLTYKYTKNIKLPGMMVRLIKGHGATIGDTEFLDDLYLASRPRAFLENLQKSRRREGVPRTLSLGEVEQKLDHFARVYGIEELNQLRDKAKAIAKVLRLEKEFKTLDQMIGALLGTHKISTLRTSQAKARAKGKAYDPYRLELFATLAHELKSSILSSIPTNLKTSKALKNFSFFEAYFSNFIEGTEFEIEEVESIIFKGKIIPNRSNGSHDILGTYKIVANSKEMRTLPKDAQNLIDLLKHRHSVLMEARSDKNPGQFKEIANRAGNTVFVKPDEVIGTLERGFDIYYSLHPGVARAIYMMFLISEVHPFLDGNGHIARIMMNAELFANNECKVMIPTVYREDYLLTLKRMSQKCDPDPYIRMLIRAQKFSATFDYSNYQEVLKKLKDANAFLRPEEGRLLF